MSSKEDRSSSSSSDSENSWTSGCFTNRSSSLSSDSESSWISGLSTNDCDFDELGENHFSRTSPYSPKLRINRDLNNRKVQERPRLLFRAFRPEHGLRARRYQDTSLPVTSPPILGSIELKDEVLAHLSEDTTYESPFLSFTSSLKRALKIIKQAPHVLHLAVIDYNVVQKCLEQRFGEYSIIWLVPEICKTYKLDDLKKVDCPPASRSGTRDRKGYTGRDEVCHNYPNFVKPSASQIPRELS